jgi:pimeloyl-ACP methyl ester carboxylesterase
MESLAVSADCDQIEAHGTRSCGRIEYHERGDGPVLVLVPGSFSTGAAWRSVVQVLRRPWRVVTTSLLGYGETEERRDPSGPRMADEIQVLEEVIRRAGRGAPVHVVGHSFGAQVALATAVRGGAPLASLCLIEPPCPATLRLAGEQTRFAEFGDMTARYAAAWNAGDREAARHVIDFYGGTGTFDAFAPRVRDFVVQTTATNLLDWVLAYADATPLQTFATVNVPTLVMRGALGHPAVRRSNELIARALPNSVLVDVADASHFMIATHAADVAGLVEAHAIARGSGRPTRAAAAVTRRVDRPG